jgi:signal transduction histidine kinase
MTGLLLLAGCASAFAEPQVIDTAVVRSAGAAAAGTPGVRVALPDSWNAQQPMRSGRYVYEMTFTLAQPAAGPYAIFIPRAGNRIQVKLNGRDLGRTGALDNTRQDYSNAPHLFQVPRSALNPEGPNGLAVTVAGEVARYAGLSRVIVGPAEQIAPMYTWRNAIQSSGSVVIVWLALVLGIVATGFSVATRNRAFMTFGIAALLWGFRTSYALVVEPPVPYQVWAWLMDVAYAGSVGFLCVSAMQVLHLLRPWMLRLAAVLGLASVFLISLYSFGSIFTARKIWLSLLLAFAALMAAQVVTQWRRRPNFANRLLMVAALGAVALGAYDHITILYSRNGYGAFAMARFSFLLFVLAMSVILMRRFNRALQIAHRARGRLQRQLANAKIALQAAYAEREKASVREALQDERQRIMRDMHDGLGAQLADMLSLLHMQNAPREDLERRVRESIDELRITIDSMEAVEGDLGTVLGALRARLERRFNGSAVRLNWQVDALPALDYLTPAKVQHVQRIVLEAFTNILKHAKATNIVVSAKAEADGIVLSVTDDGTGFDPAKAFDGHGIRNMQSRAGEIGGVLTVRQKDIGTEVRLVLPFLFPDKAHA